MGHALLVDRGERPNQGFCYFAAFLRREGLDLGRALAAGVTDNAAWRAERPGQMTVPRTQMVASILQILETRP